MKTSPAVDIGPASVLGWLAAAGGIITSAVTAITASQHDLAGPGKWAAILGVASLIFTNLGRQFQAAHLPQAAQIADTAAGIPDLMQQLAVQAQANVAKSEAAPDHVDSAAVPYSGASTK